MKHPRAPVDVLLVSATSDFGGTERVVLELAETWKARGVSFHLLVRSPFVDERFQTELQRREIEFDSLPYLKELQLSRLLPSAFKLRQYVQALRPRAINIHYPGNTAHLGDLLAMKMAGVERVVASFHHPVPIEELDAKQIYSTRLASRHWNTATVTTPYAKGLLEKIPVESSKTVVVPLGVPAPPRSWCTEESREALGLPLDKFLVGTLARLVDYKRIDLVIEACAASTRFRDLGFLVIGGTGPQRAALESLAAEKIPGRYRFLGEIDDLEPFYGALDLFMLLSDLEGYGLVFSEAGIRGVTSLASETGGTPYAVRDGETGVLVALDHRDQAWRQLDKLIVDDGERERLSRQARAFALKNASIDVMVDRFSELLLGKGG